VERNLRRHVKTHTGKKPFICKDYNKPFALELNLKRHVKTHTGEKLFICKDCNKQFALEITLRLHVHTHTGKKSFICKDCNKQFALKISLKRHLKVHTDGKLFFCHHCNKPFALEKTLKRHIKLHVYKKNVSLLDTPPTNEELKQIEFSPPSAPKMLYISSAQYRPPIKELHSLIGHPLTDEEMSLGIKGYNEHMNPQMTMWGCAVCSVRELSENQNSLELHKLCSLIKTENNFSIYYGHNAHMRLCFNVAVVNINGIEKVFYLNSCFLQSKSPHCKDRNDTWDENDCASLCSACYNKLSGKRQIIPQFSIAMGYDLGHPLRAGLKPLSTLERKLIPRNIIFATIVNLLYQLEKAPNNMAFKDMLLQCHINVHSWLRRVFFHT